MIIKFKVTNQKLTISKLPSLVVADSVDYLQAEFDFTTDDWLGVAKKAYFSFGKPDETNIPVYKDIDENGLCNFPLEILNEPGNIYVGVGGIQGSVRIPTNYVKFKLYEGVDFAGNSSGVFDPASISFSINQTTGNLEATTTDNVNFAINNNNLEVTV